MAATVLKSPQATQAVRHIVKTFVQARHVALATTQGKKRTTADARYVLPLDSNMRQGLITKLNMSVGHVLDAIIDPKEETSVRDEAKAIAAEGLKSIKEYLKKAGIQNEKTLAEVRKVMAEAEGIEVTTAGTRTENRHRQLALLAKKLKLVIQAQLYAETGSVEGLMQVLNDLEKS